MRLSLTGAGCAVVLLLSHANVHAELHHPLMLEERAGESLLRITGELSIDESEGLGRAIGSAGDFNGDGSEDFYLFSGEAGRLYIIYGGDWDPYDSPGKSIADLVASHGVRIQMTESTMFALFGFHNCAAAGDVDGDGFSDLLVGLPREDDLTGQAWLIYGSSNGYPTGSSHDIATLEPRMATRFDGISSGTPGSAALAGDSVAPAGDVDGDGTADFLIAVPDTHDAARGGRAYLFFGTPTLRNHATLALSGDVQGLALEIAPTPSHHALGVSVGPAGDFNGDGYDDIVVSAARRPFDYFVEYHVIFGAPRAAFTSPFVIGGPGSVGFRTADLSIGVEGACWSPGDMNGDGFSEIALGAPQEPPVGNPFGAFGGRVYVVSGQADPPALTLLNDIPTSHVSVVSGDMAEEYIGHRVVGLGDLNNDGLMELGIAGMESRAFLVNGSGAPLAGDGTLSVTELDGTNGVLIQQQAGSENDSLILAHAGDVNNDGRADLLAAMPTFDIGVSNTDNGRAYLFDGEGQPRERSYRFFIRAGATIPRGAGVFHPVSVPEARLWISFDNGHGGDSATSPSLQSVTMIPGADSTIWRFETDRSGWEQMTVRVKLLPQEIAGMDPDRVAIHHAPSPRGPWRRLETAFDSRHRIASAVSAATGYFTIHEETTNRIEGLIIY